MDFIKTNTILVNEKNFNKMQKTKNITINKYELRNTKLGDEYLVTFTSYSTLSYEQLVNKLVAEKYTIQEELAIQRKAYNGLTDEFRIYNAYVEECKERAKQFIKERESVLNVNK